MACGYLMLELIGCPLDVQVVTPALLVGRWARVDAARSVEAVVIVDDGGVMDDCVVHVHVVHHGPIYIDDRGVVCEHAAVPLAAHKSDAKVAEAVIKPTIKSNVGSPIARVPNVNSAAIAPVAGRPKEPNTRRRNPHARHPVITSRTPGPVARRPDVAVLRAGRLLVSRQRGWPDVDRYSNGDLCERRR